MRVGITGHMDLSTDTQRLISESLHEVLSTYPTRELVGVSCLARGADQVFASVVLEIGGTLEAVIPSRDYRDKKVAPDNVETFDSLLGKASKVLVMPFDEACREAYEAANNTVLDTADVLYAVWDGQPPTGKGGGTADTVTEARRRGLPVTVIWPEGASRGHVD